MLNPILRTGAASETSTAAMTAMLPMPSLALLRGAILSACLSGLSGFVLATETAQPATPAPMTASTTAAGAAADATKGTMGLPDAEWMRQLISRHPAWLAQLAQTRSERHLAEQKRAGPHEWTPSVQYGRRTYEADAATPRTTQSEWEAALERGIRLPGKAQAAELAAQRQGALAEARQQQAWRQLSLQAITLYADWLREQRQEQVWQDQVKLLTQQSEAVNKRQKLGDAAQIDSIQMQASLTQARLQAQAAAQRRQARWTSLQASFPGWPAQLTTPALPDASPTLSTEQLQALLGHTPDARAALFEADFAQAQAELDRRDTTADPTVGVKVAQARGSAEKMLALTLSWPIGGAARSLGAQSSAALAEAAAQRREDVQRQVSRDLSLLQQEAQDSLSQWQLAQQALQQLQSVARSLDKGFALGEGALSEVLQARRLANEQALVAAQAEVDAWQAQWRWALQRSALWPAP